jgi:hypothetical protein
MEKRITTNGAVTIGLDLSDKSAEGCVTDETGQVVERFRVRTTQAGLERVLTLEDPQRFACPPCSVTASLGCEVGLSPMHRDPTAGSWAGAGGSSRTSPNQDSVGCVRI